MKTLLAWAMMAVSVTGCAGPMGSTSGYYARHPDAHRHEARESTSNALEGIAAAVDLTIAIRDSASSDAEADDDDLPPATDGAYRPYVPPPPPRVTAPDPVHVAFDQTKAHLALEAVDLSACAAQGAPAGYGRARVTFGVDGKVTQVAVQAPNGLSNEAVECVGERIGAVSVPAFDGAPIAMEASYRVP